MRPDALRKLLLASLAPLLLASLAVGLTRRGPRPGATPFDLNLPLAGQDHLGAGFFAGGDPPRSEVPALDPAVLDATSPGGWFQVGVVARFADGEAASAAARVARELLADSAADCARDPELRRQLLDEQSPPPLTPRVGAALARLGVRSTVGLGFAGTPHEAAQAVVELGRLLVVRDLKGDYAGQAPHPLLEVFRALGGEAWTQGDPVRDPELALDLSCAAPDPDAAQALVDACEHYAAFPAGAFLRPPWHPAGVGGEEARARATWAALCEARQQGLRDAGIEGYLYRVATSMDEAEAEEVLRELHAAVQRTVLPRLRACAELPGADRAVVDAAVAAAERSGSRRAFLDPELEVPREVLARVGQLGRDVHAGGGRVELAPGALEGAYSARVQARVVDGRLELGTVRFQRLDRGLLGLVVYLQRAGCRDLRLEVVAPGE
ncbi:MAG: hypothetical protein R3F62_16495 [Planctomycetota bacterium]